MKKALLLFTVCAVVLGSCSIERRLYRPGLSIQWHSVKKNVDKDTPDDVLASDVSKGEPLSDHQNTKIDNSPSGLNGSSVETSMDIGRSDDGSEIDDVTDQVPSSVPQFSDNEDTTRVNIEEQEVPVEEDPYNDARSNNKYGWVYVLLLIILYAIIAAILYIGALYPFHAGVVLLFPLSFLFGLEDRAGFLFGIFSGMSYIGLYFLTGSVGFWGIFFLGLLAFIISIILATYLDDIFDRGERQEDYPPPPPPQVDPGEDW